MTNKKTPHPVAVFFMLWWAVAVLSWVGSVYSWDGIENILSAEALRWFLRYTEENIMSSPVLYGVIMLFMGGGMFVHSGLKTAIVRTVRRDRKLSGKERGSLVAAGMAAAVYAAVLSLLVWGPWNIVRGVTGRLADSPLHDGALYVTTFGIGFVSVVYGFTADYYRRHTDVVEGMSCLFAKYSSYIVSLVFAIQFMAAFHYSGFPGLMGMTDMMLDILYWACCILPLFYTNSDKK